MATEGAIFFGPCACNPCFGNPLPNEIYIRAGYTTPKYESSDIGTLEPTINIDSWEIIPNPNRPPYSYNGLSYQDVILQARGTIPASGLWRIGSGATPLYPLFSDTHVNSGPLVTGDPLLVGSLLPVGDYQLVAGSRFVIRLQFIAPAWASRWQFPSGIIVSQFTQHSRLSD